MANLFEKIEGLLGVESAKGMLGIETIVDLGLLDETPVGRTRFRTWASIATHDGLFHLGLKTAWTALLGGTSTELLIPYSKTAADDTTHLRARLGRIAGPPETRSEIETPRAGRFLRYCLRCSRLRLGEHAGSLVLLEGDIGYKSIETWHATRGDLAFLVVHARSRGSSSLFWVPMTAIAALRQALDDLVVP